MLSRLRQHWSAKLGSLLAAAIVWYLLREVIRADDPPIRPAFSTPASSGRFP